MIFKNHLKRNVFIYCYILISIFIEYLAVLVTSNKLHISNPLIFFTIIFSGALILLAIRKQKLRYAFCAGFLCFHAVFCLIFITTFTLTSGTVFDFAQFNLTQDGMGTIESFKPNFGFVFPTFAILGLFIILGFHYLPLLPSPKPESFIRTTVICLLCVSFALQGYVAYSKNYNKSADMTYILYNAPATNYSDQGIIGNFVNQLYKGAFFSNVELGDEDELESYIYENVSDPTNVIIGTHTTGGMAKDMNVVCILAESFEWFSFISDLQKYPNGIDADENVLRNLFPNLYDLYDTSFIFDNHHSREKTDISENYSILGCYPTGVYVNYDFANNTVPFSMPNVMKSLEGVSSNIFHNGKPNFYNRTDYFINSAGFESFVADDTMLEISTRKEMETGVKTFTDYTLIGERNLDSEMIETCKELMFPLSERFYTNITTYTGHGKYGVRTTLKDYYNKLDENGLLPYQEDDAQNEKAFLDNNLRTYVATAMELDKMVGKINEYLIENNLYDNTMLVIYGDHNAYYESLSAYVKGLEQVTNTRNYTELFRVPLMIRVGSKTATLTKQERTINKFTCSADIVPTIYDLLGISYFTNMCYGVSAFNSEKTTVLYSRAYEAFITEKMYFYSLNNVIYKSPDVTEEYVNQITEDATELMIKTSHINRIYYNDYFKGNKGRTFTRKMIEIQK